MTGGIVVIKEAIGVGASVVEATEDAKLQLGLVDTDEFGLEIIQTEKKKTLGIFGGSPAKVRVYIEVPDEKPSKPQKKKEDKKDFKKPAEDVNTKKETAEKKEVKVSSEPVYSDAVDASEIPADTPAGKAVAYLKTVLQAIGLENISIKVALRDNGAMITLDGEGLGVIIGRRGDTLDALQYLTSLSSNIGNGYYRVSLNIGNYREKREKTLIELAEKVSAQVKQNGRSRSLEPMNPYERRIIHTAIQGIEGVTSSSVGDGDFRHVIVSPEGGDTRPPRNGRRDRRDRRPREEKIVGGLNHQSDSADLPLYGKISK